MIELGKKEVNSRQYTSWFNFRGGDQQKPVGQLSGGERNRVHLAKLLKSGGNVLLLDEPTNDLDVDTLRALEEALLDFAGCAVVITHDRWFLDRVATHILAFEGDSQVTWFEGTWGEYAEWVVETRGPEALEPHRIKYKPLVRAGYDEDPRGDGRPWCCSATRSSPSSTSAGAIAAHPGRYLIGYGRDPQIFVWSFAWWLHAVETWQNPFVSHAIYAPDGVNLVWVDERPRARRSSSRRSLRCSARASPTTSPRCSCPALAAFTRLPPLPPPHRLALGLARRRLPVRLLELHARPAAGPPAHDGGRSCCR